LQAGDGEVDCGFLVDGGRCIGVQAGVFEDTAGGVGCVETGCQIGVGVDAGEEGLDRGDWGTDREISNESCAVVEAAVERVLYAASGEAELKSIVGRPL
jgi:hypothetical protein